MGIDFEVGRVGFGGLILGAIAAVSAIAILTSVSNAWTSFPTSDIERVVIEIERVEPDNLFHDKLFLPDHPMIPRFEIDDPEAATQLARMITGVQGVAGAVLPAPERYGAERMGVISFFTKKQRYDVTISNVGFFMGLEMNDFYMFHSWALAKLVNDAALKVGPGLRQGGFNSLCGAGSIAGDQYFEFCEGNWDRAKWDAYENRPAELWNIFLDRSEWETVK